MTLKLIGICGPAGCGKDSLTDALIRASGNKITRYSFATPLKRGVSAMFGWTLDQLEDRIFKEEVDPFWGFSPREAMQKLGTEYGRNSLKSDIWLIAAKQELELSDNPLIISDVRFENEAAFIRENSGEIIHIKRPDIEKEFETIHSAEVAKHASESGVNKSAIDFEFSNHGTLEDMKTYAEFIIRFLKV